MDAFDFGAGQRVGGRETDGDGHSLFVDGDGGSDFAGGGGDFDGEGLVQGGLGGGPFADGGEFGGDDKARYVFLCPGFDGDICLAGGGVAPPSF